MEDFYARKTSIDRCAALKERMSNGVHPRGIEWSPLASTSDDGHEKVDCVRIMKEISNGVENTATLGRCFPLFSPLFLYPTPSRPCGPIVTGLRSFVAAVGSTR